MPVVRIVTINILNDLSRWDSRKSLLSTGLKALSPDVVVVQEVRLPENPARWLLAELGSEHLYLSPKYGWEGKREAIATLSRFPFKDSATLHLGGQGRVAQRVHLEIDGLPLWIVNGHFYWQPGESAVRLKQVQQMRDWLESTPGAPPAIVCGDFNSTPETRAISCMKEAFQSAHEHHHGVEPEYTCPTPLPRASWPLIRTLLGFFFLLRPAHLNMSWRGTLDYIFIDPRLEVRDCRVVLDQPSSQDARIYPSDHLGLFAEIEF
jgi:endonuclease/exonuclease/phosphatase family metal-dependent hydrolase